MDITAIFILSAICAVVSIFLLVVIADWISKKPIKRYYRQYKLFFGTKFKSVVAVSLINIVIMLPLSLIYGGGISPIIALILSIVLSSAVSIYAMHSFHPKRKRPKDFAEYMERVKAQRERRQKLMEMPARSLGFLKNSAIQAGETLRQIGKNGLDKSRVVIVAVRDKTAEVLKSSGEKLKPKAENLKSRIGGGLSKAGEFTKKTARSVSDGVKKLFGKIRRKNRE
jgi:ElaB/YqjD/DUF883 family membrane-anchored ribosome-binding protein